MSNPARRLMKPRVLAGGMVVCALAAIGVWAAKPDVFFMPHRFREVEGERLYRGGDPSTAELERMTRKYGIRTVVSMVEDKPRGDDNVLERQRAEKCGLQFYNYPMPGNGLGDFDALDAAADRIEQARKEPVFFHCAAGKNRSNAVQAAWRLRHCGWSIEQTLTELQQFGLDAAEDAKLTEHLRKYYEERILPRRSAASQRA